MKWFKRYRPVKLALLFAIGWYALPRAYTSIRFAGQIHRPSLETQFEGLSELLPSPGTKPLKFYQGLPHHRNSVKAFLQSVWFESNVKFHGYLFRRDVWQPEPQQQAVIVETLLSPASFTPYSGGSGCGGFHADFMVRFESADGMIDMMICTNCGEVLIFSPKGSRIVDFSPNTYRNLESVWKDLKGVHGH